MIILYFAGLKIVLLLRYYYGTQMTPINMIITDINLFTPVWSKSPFDPTDCKHLRYLLS